MKKVALAIVAVLMIAFSYAQDFMGVKVDGKIDDVIRNMSAKGFTVVKKSPDNTYLKMKGKVGGENIEFAAVFTSVSKVCWKFVIYFDKDNSWYSLKAQYNKMLTMLTEKYGKPTDEFAFFTKPYYDGDGYELTALAVEKAHYAAYWKNLSLEISKFKQVSIGYENPDNIVKKDEEANRVNKNAF
jgi:hypothetical protein